MEGDAFNYDGSFDHLLSGASGPAFEHLRAQNEREEYIARLQARLSRIAGRNVVSPLTISDPLNPAGMRMLAREISVLSQVHLRQGQGTDYVEQSHDLENDRAPLLTEECSDSASVFDEHATPLESRHARLGRYATVTSPAPNPYGLHLCACCLRRLLGCCSVMIALICTR